MKKTILILFLSLVLAIGLSAPSFAAKKICKLGHVNSPASIFQFGALAFKEAVEKSFPTGRLKSTRPANWRTLALIQGLTLGTVDIYTEFISTFADQVPEYQVFAVHYKFDSVMSRKIHEFGNLHQNERKNDKRNGITNIGDIRAGRSTTNSAINRCVRWPMPRA